MIQINLDPKIITNIILIIAALVIVLHVFRKYKTAKTYEEKMKIFHDPNIIYEIWIILYFLVAIPMIFVVTLGLMQSQ